MDLPSFLPQFGNIFIAIAAFVAALSVIVTIHEYGHYIVGRWTGIKAEVFSLGFGPVLCSRVDKHGTKWQIAALPLGGYVKFLGDANAASAGDSDEVAEMPPEVLRQTMSGAPVWARALTVAAGPVFNFVFSILVFMAVLMFQGRPIDPLTVGKLHPLPVEGVTLQQGDVLLSVAGVDLPAADSGASFWSSVSELPKEQLLDYTVRRDGAVTHTKGPYPLPAIVGGVQPLSAAYKAGLKRGDVITAVDGTPVVDFNDLKAVVEASGGRALPLKVWRDGRTLDQTLVARRTDEPKQGGGFHTQWRIGVYSGQAFESATQTLGPIDAARGGMVWTGNIITGSLSGLYHMVTGAISSCNMSGPIGIAKLSGAMVRQGTESFIVFIAMLSTAVGLLNLFPIPVLDGGHLVFHAYEAVRGKKPSERAINILMSTGLVLILSLMVFAIGNDLFCP